MPDIRARKALNLPPNRLAEYSYYALVAYGIFAPTWNISVPFLGIAGLGILAIYCLKWTTGGGKPIYSSLAFPFGCAITFMVIQVFVHDQSLLNEDNRAFFTWVMGVTIVQSLLTREGFFNRFALAAFVIGLLLLPHLSITSLGAEGGPERAGLEAGIGYSNPNDLASWFGFCCVYFIIHGIENRRNLARLASFGSATVCLFVVTLTVSRGALMAVAIAVIIAFRRSLKRGFLPILFFAVLGSIILLSGLFDPYISEYIARGTEDTGRLSVWPLAIERVADSLLFGVGIDKIGTYVPDASHEVTPHNGFLYIGLASGIIPLAFFTAYCIKAVRGTFPLSERKLQDSAFQLPLMTYAFIIISLGQNAFMYPWAIVTLCHAMPRRESRNIGLRLRKTRADEHVIRRPQTGHSITRGRS